MTWFSETSTNWAVCCNMERTALLMLTTQAGSSWSAHTDSTVPSCQEKRRGRFSNSLAST